MSPRPFERPATIALPESEDLAAGSSLEGLWLPARGEEGEPNAIARGGAIVAAPHPLMGGAMDSPVATEIALAASDSGYGALRFNWRGVGASAGTPSGEIEEADADYRAALEFMEDAGEDETGEGPLVACGYSWGSLAAARLMVSSHRVRRAVLIAPPPAMLDGAALAVWGHPVLVIAGDRDTYVPVDELKACLESVPNAEVFILEDVDHFFMNGLVEVGRIVRDWLRG